MKQKTKQKTKMENVEIEVHMDIKGALLKGCVVKEWETVAVSPATIGGHWELLVNSLERRNPASGGGGWRLYRIKVPVFGTDLRNDECYDGLTEPTAGALVVQIERTLAELERKIQEAQRKLQEFLVKLETEPLDLQDTVELVHGTRLEYRKAVVERYPFVAGLLYKDRAISYSGVQVALSPEFMTRLNAAFARADQQAAVINAREQEAFKARKEVLEAQAAAEAAARKKREEEAETGARAEREALRIRVLAENLDLAGLLRARKARKGKPSGSNAGGSYWALVNAEIRSYGGDGIGQSDADKRDFFVVRHYRDGSLSALVRTEAHHQNTGVIRETSEVPEALKVRTIEELVVCLKAANFRVTGDGVRALIEAIPELPEAPTAPDEDTAPASSRTYAQVGWRAGDVCSRRPDWTEAQAENWLVENQRALRDALVAHGRTVLESLLPAN